MDDDLAFTQIQFRVLLGSTPQYSSNHFDIWSLESVREPPSHFFRATIFLSAPWCQFHQDASTIYLLAYMQGHIVLIVLQVGGASGGFLYCGAGPFLLATSIITSQYDRRGFLDSSAFIHVIIRGL